VRCLPWLCTRARGQGCGSDGESEHICWWRGPKVAKLEGEKKGTKGQRDQGTPGASLRSPSVPQSLSPFRLGCFRPERGNTLDDRAAGSFEVGGGVEEAAEEQNGVERQRRRL